MKTAETRKKETLLEAKEEILSSKNEFDREVKDRRAELTRLERRVAQKEEALDKKSETLEKKDELLSRELVLIKVSCNAQQRHELISIADITHAKISDISVDSMTLELSDREEKIHNFQELLRPYGIKEIVRTGTIAIQKGTASLRI